MTLVLLLMLQGRTSGGHGLLEAVPRIYQVTPTSPTGDERQNKRKSGPAPADSLKESQLAARSGPSPPRRTSPTTRIQTASLNATASADAIRTRTAVETRQKRGRGRRLGWRGRGTRASALSRAESAATRLSRPL